MIRVTTWILPGSTVGYGNELVRNLKVILNINFTLALWSRLGTSYPDIFKSATFSLRMQKFPRPQVSKFKSNLPHTHPDIFWTGNFFFARTVLNIHEKELGLILWRQWIKKYPDLASTHFRIHSGFKNFHSGVRTQKVADSSTGFTGFVWTEALSRKKKLRIQQYPGTCERGLWLSGRFRFIGSFN